MTRFFQFHAERLDSTYFRYNIYFEEIMVIMMKVTWLGESKHFIFYI